MEPYWWVKEADAMQAVATGEGPSCMLIITSLCGAVVALVGYIVKDTADDKKEAKEREAQLMELLKKPKGEEQ
jgi:hypothetical protein